jgi:hypothetical protein
MSVSELRNMYAEYVIPSFRTYQEGVLPRRRLVFTHSQIYFQCLETHACESITGFLDAEQEHWDPDSSTFHSLRNNMQVFPPLYLTQSRQFQIELRIREYLQRTLTYESDILKAFMGVLRHAWYQDPPIYHFWGLPFFPGPKAEQSLGPRFLDSLLWTPRPSTIPPWSYGKRPPPFTVPHFTRRDAFPSWTWAGWQCLQGVETTNPRRRVAGLDGVVLVENMKGRRLSVEDYITEMEDSWNMNDFYPFLHLTGWLTMLRILAPTTQDRGFRVADPSSVEFAPLEFMAASSFEKTTYNTSGCPTDTWPAIIFLPVPDLDETKYLEGILLAPIEHSRRSTHFVKTSNTSHVPVESASYQRIGTFSVNLGYYWEWGNRGDHSVAFHNGTTAYAYQECNTAYLPLENKEGRTARLYCERRTIKLV